MANPIDIVAAEIARRQAGGPTPQGMRREQEYRLNELQAQRAFEAQQRLEQQARETARHNQALEALRFMAEQRAQEEKSRKEAEPKWQLQPDEEGRQWYVDATGRNPPRPLQLPGAGGTSEQVRKLQPLTGQELGDVRENLSQIGQAVKAYQLMQGRAVEGAVGDTEATGWKGFVWDPILQRLDPMGVDARAAVGNIGSLKIKQRSGGAVPAAEMERLKPFVPRETDDPDVARKKLRGFIQEYAKMMEEDLGAFSMAGRRVPIALQKSIKDTAKQAREIAGGGSSEAEKTLRMLKEELARRRGAQ